MLMDFFLQQDARITVTGAIIASVKASVSVHQRWGNTAVDPRNDKAYSRPALETKPLSTVSRDKMVSVLDICHAFRSYLKPRFSFSQAGRAYYFTNPLLPSSLAKSKPDGELETIYRHFKKQYG
jgi:hypothetical protein